MILSPTQEEFMREFFARQREISKQSLENVTLLAKANIESILESGLESPPTIEKMGEILEQLKLEKTKRDELIGTLKEMFEDVKAPESNGDAQQT